MVNDHRNFSLLQGQAREPWSGGYCVSFYSTNMRHRPGQDTRVKRMKDQRMNTFVLVLWAHGLHLLFFPVWPVYSIDVFLDRVNLNSQKKLSVSERGLCIAQGRLRSRFSRPQLINIQWFPK